MKEEFDQWGKGIWYVLMHSHPTTLKSKWVTRIVMDRHPKWYLATQEPTAYFHLYYKLLEERRKYE
jgi:hypothetical protein